MKSKCSLAGKILCLLFLANGAYAQGVGASGSIQGSVIDPAGAAVAKASVAAIETAKGTQHITVTDDSGHYRFSGLAPSTYSITAEGQGFAREARTDVTVVLGETAIVDRKSV